MRLDGGSRAATIAGWRGRRRALAAVAALAVLAALPARGQNPRTSIVAATARDWLALVDRGDAGAARNAAAAKFRDAAPADRWAKALAAQRGHRGKVLQRTLASTRFEKSFPGAPEGEYAVLAFRTAFENSPGGTETVTLEREADGIWRVVGYVIQ
jgi:hypothetical protein